MFQLKDFKSILAAMVNIARGTSGLLTDFRPGSVTRTLLEAPSAEIEELYIQMYQGIVAAIPVAIYGAFVFDLLPATAAYGPLTFSRTGAAAQDYPIPAGTRVRTTGGQEYITTAAGTLETGDTSVSVVAVCTTAGTAGNVSAGAITSLTTAINGIEAVTNTAAFVTGRDAETEDERKARFVEYIATLTRGTKSAVEYGARTGTLTANGLITEYVTEARCIEYDDDSTVPIGTIRVIVHNGVSGASTDLVARVQDIIDGYLSPDGTYVPGWKAAGIVASVQAAALLTIPVVQSVPVSAGYTVATVRAQVEAAQREYVAALGVGRAVLRAELIAAAMNIEGVTNCIMTQPAADVAVPIDQVGILSTVTFS